MVLTRKTNFFDGSSCFKFNKLGLALGMTFKFYTSVGKRLKLKVRKLWGLILTFVEVPGEKLVGGAFLPPILNRVNCRNHRLSLCWPYLIKNIEYAQLLLDYDAVSFGVFQYSPKTGGVLESVPSIYGKKPLKILKAAVTQWLTQGRASKQILDCFRELMETIDKIGLNTADSQARGHRALLTNHKALFCVCFMTDILSNFEQYEHTSDGFTEGGSPSCLYSVSIQSKT